MSKIGYKSVDKKGVIDMADLQSSIFKTIMNRQTEDNYRRKRTAGKVATRIAETKNPFKVRNKYLNEGLTFLELEWKGDPIYFPSDLAKQVQGLIENEEKD